MPNMSRSSAHLALRGTPRTASIRNTMSFSSETTAATASPRPPDTTGSIHYDTNMEHSLWHPTGSISYDANREHSLCHEQGAFIMTQTGSIHLCACITIVWAKSLSYTRAHTDTHTRTHIKARMYTEKTNYSI